jgi:hypothetical protein
VKKIVVLMAVMAGTMALPFIALLALVGVAGTAIACTPDLPLSSTAPVPAVARNWVVITRAACPVLPATFIAAVMAQESGFRPDAYADDKNGGTWGLFQLNASIWQNAYGAPWSADLNVNGVWDVKDPEIHAAVAGKYLCARLDGVRRIRAAHPDWASTRDLSELDGLVIAHNAGEGRLESYPAIPAITSQFILNVRGRMSAWAAADLVPATKAVPRASGSKEPTSPPAILATEHPAVGPSCEGQSPSPSGTC